MMNRLALSILLTSLIPISTGCSAPFIGEVSFNMGGPDDPLLKDDVENGTSSVENCPTYHPTPDSVKAYLKANNDTDQTLNPWAGWLLDLRRWLEADCK